MTNTPNQIEETLKGSLEQFQKRSVPFSRELEPFPAECEPSASTYLLYSQQSTEETGNLFKESRVHDAATAIADCILRQFSEHEGDVYNAMASTTSYDNGLKNGETILALMRAASIVQIAMSRKLAGMHADLAEDDEEDEEDGFDVDVSLIDRT